MWSKRSQAASALPEPRTLQLERLEDRLLWSAMPEVAITGLAGSPLINEAFSFNVTFDNDSAQMPTADTGYGPFVDVALPAGIDLNSVSLFGNPAAFQVVGFYDATDMQWEDAAGGGGNAVLEHPLNANIALPGPLFGGVALSDDYQLISVQLPFGSYVADQPATTLQFNVATNGGAGGSGPAVVGQPLDILARGGFMFGEDEFDNAPADPVVFSSDVTGQTTPTVLQLSKSSDRPEGEVPTGANYPVTYTLNVNVANLETAGVSGVSGGLNDVVVQDLLPAGFILDTTFGGGDGVLATLNGGGALVGENVNAGVLTVTADFLTGTASGSDLVIQYRGHYGDATVDDIAAPGNTSVLNEAQVVAGYDPDGIGTMPLGQIDSGLDSGPTLGVADGGSDFAITVKLIDIQKGVDDGSTTPGDINTWTLTIEVSDHDAFDTLSVQDIFTDGLEYIAGSAALTVDQDGATTVTAGLFDDDGLNGDDDLVVTVDPGPGATAGFTTMNFDLSAALSRLVPASGGALTGDIVSDGVQQGATTAVITYQTRVLDKFRSTFPSGDQSVDLGDTFDNNVTVTGTTVAGGFVESDDSSASLGIAGISIDKEIYAINGVNPAPANPTISNGETVTYLLRVTLPSADTENLVVTDYLPLPIFDATTVTTTFNTTPGAAAPSAGESRYGSGHTLNTFDFSGGDGGTSPNNPPTVTVDGVANTVSFDFGSFDSNDTGPAVIEILFTVAAIDKPFADGLPLTNQMQATYGTTSTAVVSEVEIVQIELVQPQIEITKGVVSSDRPAMDDVYDPDPAFPATAMFADPGIAPGTTSAFSGMVTTDLLNATPIDSDVDEIDAGDLVKFAVVLHSTGQDDVLDVLFRDTLADGFEIPSVPTGLNFQVFDGTGSAIALADLRDQSGGMIMAADIASYFFSNVAGAGDNGGIRLANPIDVGITDTVLNTKNATGSNVIIITYDLQLDDQLDANFSDITPDASITNTAEILEFYAQAMGSGGRDFSKDDMNMQLPGFDDSATVTVASPTIAKTLVSSDEPSTSDPNLTVGETATYELTITVPEGITTGLSVVDNIPTGMDFTGFVLDTSGFGGRIVGGGVLNTAAVMQSGGGGNGADVTFLFPDLEVDATTGSTNNVLVLRYTAVVLDESSNTAAQSLPNQAQVDWATNPDVPVQSNQVTATVALPQLAISKTFLPGSADAGDTLTIQLQVTNSGGSAAYGVDVSDILDTNNLSFAGNFSISGGGFVGNHAAGTVTFTGGTVAAMSAATLSFDVTPTGDVVAGEMLLNTATITAADTHINSPSEQRDVSGATGNGTLTINNPTIAKSLTDTEIDNSATSMNNDDNQAVVGELLTYTLVVTVPEGETESVTVVDTLQSGLGFVGLVSITPSANVVKTSGMANFSDVAPSVSADGRTVTFSLGTIDNNNVEDASLVAETADTLTIVYQVMVTGLASDGDNLTNSAVLNWSNGTANDSAATVEVIQPELTVDKQVEVDNGGGFVLDGEGDRDDPIRYTITITHSATSDTDAFDGTFTDAIPADINVTSVTVTHSVDGDLFTTGTSDFELTGNTVQTASGRTFALDAGAGGGPGETITIVVNGTLLGSVTPGGMISNSANITYSTIPGDGSDRSTFVPDAENDERTLIAGDSAVTNIIGLSPSKSIVQTSESHTGIDAGVEELAIGEIVRYRLEVTLAEAMFNNFIIADNLPGIPGGELQYIDGSARLAFVSASGTNITSSDGGLDTSLTGAGVIGTTNVGVTPSYTLPDINVSTQRASDDDNYAGGTDVFFKLGDLTNADTDLNSEFVIIEFNAVVLNSSANQAVNNADGSDLSAGLANVFEVEVGGVVTATSNSVDARVVEPYVTLDSKVINPPAPTDAGDTVTYVITLTNNDTGENDVATAFDINVRDALDANLDLLNVTNVVVSVPAGSAATNNSNAGTNVVDIVIDRLDPGDSATVTITASVVANASAGAAIANTATMTYSSVPGNGTVGNPTGTDLATINNGLGIDQRDGQHDGSGAPLNDYNDSLSATVVSLAAPGVDKLAPASATYGIGETVTYTINVTLSEGLTQDLVVVDNLPVLGALDLMRVVGSRIVSIGGSTNAGDNFGGNLSGSGLAIGVAGVASSSNGGADDDRVTFTLGDIQNAPDGVSDANDIIVIEVDAVITNIANNQAGVTLTNDADLSFTDPETGTTIIDDVSDPTITIVEPLLTIDKTVTSGTANVDAGDTVQYTIVIAHDQDTIGEDSTADAFDLNLADTLPADLENLMVISANHSTVGNIAGAFAINGTSGVLSTTGDVDLPLGDTITLVIEGTVRDTVNPGDTLSNSATVSWTGNDGASPDERNGGGGVNDYSATDPSADIVVPGTLDVTKSANVATGVVGDVIVYTLQVTLAEGTITNFAIDDNLPTGLVYLGDAMVSSNPSSMVFAGFSANIVGSQLQIRATSITNPGDVDNAATLETDTFEITYSARIGNAPAIQNGLALVNDADASADGGLSDPNNQATVTVREPLLVIDKTVDNLTPHYNDVLNYTVVISHDSDGLGVDSTADAFDLVLSDLITDPALSFVDASLTAVTTGAGVFNLILGDDAGETGVSVELSTLEMGQTLTLTYSAQVTNQATTFGLGTGLDNTATVQYDTQPGPNANERPLTTDDDVTATVVGADLRITKTNGETQLTPGALSTYTLTVFNDGTDLATGVTVTDILPVGFSFISASNGGVEATPGVVSWTLPDIAIGGSFFVTLDVLVNNPAPAGFTQYTNTASVSHDDAEPTPANNSATDQDAINGAPNLAITKRVDGATEGFDSSAPITYIVEVTNSGNQNASGVTVVDTFPIVSLDFVGVGADVTGPGDSTFTGFDGQFITWDLGTVEAGEVVTLSVFGSVKAPLPILITDFVNIVDIFDDGTSNPDPDPTNNNATASAELIARPDITVSKTDGLDEARPGQDIEYTIEVANIGGQGATGIIVTDLFPTELLENVAASNNGVIDPLAGTITWLIPALDGFGDSIVLTVNASIVSSLPFGVEQITNIVSAFDDGTNGSEFNPNNNTTEDVTRFAVFAFDSLRNAAMIGAGNDDFFRAPGDELVFSLPPLPVSPIYSGWAEPGTTLEIAMFDQSGNSIGSQTVVADSGGNWVATFPNVIVKDHPYSVKVDQIASLHNGSTATGFNFRTYFSPAIHGHVFWSKDLSPNGVAMQPAQNIMNSMLQHDRTPLPMGWNDFYGYEFLASSSTPAQYAG